MHSPSGKEPFIAELLASTRCCFIRTGGYINRVAILLYLITIQVLPDLKRYLIITKPA
jgi:hypothetical protein